MSPHYASVAQRAGHRCEYCRAPEAIFNSPFEVEHVVPTSRSGVDDLSNLALACRSCNVHKAAHLTGEDEATRSAAALFHPRRDQWARHCRPRSARGAAGELATVCLSLPAPLPPGRGGGAGGGGT